MKAGSMKDARWPLLIPLAIALCACGGGGDGGDDVSCSPAPSISSSPPQSATVGTQYRYTVDASYSCFGVVFPIPFPVPGTCHGVVGTTVPAGATVSGRTVSWTPDAASANTRAQFGIATPPDLCGKRATQSWSVQVQPPPPAQVLSMSPSVNAVDVSILSSVSISFDQPMDSSSVNASSLQVVGPAGAVPGTYAVGGTTITFTPSSRLSYGSTYVVSISSALRTKAGGTLRASQQWSFATGQPVVEPVTLEPTNIGVASATLNGRLVVPFDAPTLVWFEYGPSSAYGSATEKQSLSTEGDHKISAALNGLPERGPVHYRLIAENSAGRFTAPDVSFATLVTPRVLADDLDAPIGLVARGAHVYWLEIYGNKVMRMHLASGLSEALAMGGVLGNSGSLTLDATHAYWSGGQGEIRRTALDGSGTIAIAAKSDYISQLKVHTSGLYVKHGNSISRMNPDGSNATVIHTRVPRGSEGFGGDMVMDDTSIYWTDYYLGTLSSMPLDGGEATILAAGLRYPAGIVLRDQYLYFSDDLGIRRMGIHGGSVTTIAPVSGSIAIDGTAMYVGTESTVALIDLESGRMQLLVAGQTRGINGSGCITELAIDASSIYWICSGNRYYPPMGSIRSISR